MKKPGGLLPVIPAPKKNKTAYVPLMGIALVHDGYSQYDTGSARTTQCRRNLSRTPPGANSSDLGERCDDGK